MECTLVVFVAGRKPFVIPPYTPVPEMDYELYVWTEKGKVRFSHEAAWDHYEEFGTWPPAEEVYDWDELLIDNF